MLSPADACSRAAAAAARPERRLLARRRRRRACSAARCCSPHSSSSARELIAAQVPQHRAALEDLIRHETGLEITFSRLTCAGAGTARRRCSICRARGSRTPRRCCAQPELSVVVDRLAHAAQRSAGGRPHPAHQPRDRSHRRRGRCRGAWRRCVRAARRARCSPTRRAGSRAGAADASTSRTARCASRERRGRRPSAQPAARAAAAARRPMERRSAPAAARQPRRRGRVSHCASAATSRAPRPQRHPLPEGRTARLRGLAPLRADVRRGAVCAAPWRREPAVAGRLPRAGAFTA